jgi:hypothetical protein
MKYADNITSDLSRTSELSIHDKLIKICDRLTLNIISIQRKSQKKKKSVIHLAFSCLRMHLCFFFFFFLLLNCFVSRIHKKSTQ